jgi:hypothetical protein
MRERNMGQPNLQQFFSYLTSKLRAEVHEVAKGLTANPEKRITSNLLDYFASDIEVGVEKVIDDLIDEHFFGDGYDNLKEAIADAVTEEGGTVNFRK